MGRIRADHKSAALGPASAATGPGRGRVPGRVDISERPAVVEQQSRAGDWGVHTIIWAGHARAFVSAVDRMSQYTLWQAMTRQAAALVAGAVSAMLQPVKSLALSVIADNGEECAGHRGRAEALGVDVYFARPYPSFFDFFRRVVASANGLAGR